MHGGALGSRMEDLRSGCRLMCLLRNVSTEYAKLWATSRLGQLGARGAGIPQSQMGDVEYLVPIGLDNDRVMAVWIGPPVTSLGCLKGLLGRPYHRVQESTLLIREAA